MRVAWPLFAGIGGNVPHRIESVLAINADAKSAPLIYRVGTWLLLATMVQACAVNTSVEDSLFRRIGGMPVIEAVVAETIDAVVADPKTRRSFEGIKLPAFKQSVAAQFCVLAGGACKYEGENMKKAHTGLKITDTEFDVMVGALRTALARRVGEREKNEMLRLLAPMKRDIVGA